MSDTPETDDQPIIYAMNDLCYQVLCVDLEFARRLERERDEALMDRANGDIATMTRNHYERILRERDEAIKKIQRQAERICQLEGATNHAGGTPLSLALRERDEAREQNAKLRDIAESAIWRMVNGVCLPDASAVRAINEEGIRLRAKLEQLKEEVK